MSQAVVCPVCCGSGKYKKPEDNLNLVVCHGCGGKGWVEVGDPPSGLPLYPVYPWYPRYGTFTPWYWDYGIPVPTCTIEVGGMCVK